MKILLKCQHAWINQWFHNKSCLLWWPVSLSIRIQITLSHIRFVLYQICWQLKTPSPTWKCTCCIMQMTTCMHQLSFQKLLQTRSTCRSNKKTLFGKRVMKRTHWPRNYISICFYPVWTSKKMFFLQSASSKRHCVTHWCKQRGMNSYQQWQTVVKL